MLTRRVLLGSVAAASAVAVTGALFGWRLPMFGEAQAFEVSKSDAEWRRILTPAQYQVLRRQGTERPHSSALDQEHRKGTFTCAGCNLALFSSDTKFESHTGWPSFWQPLPNAIGMSNDDSLFRRRTEVHCRRCGGHLGHVFEDGPAPTGLRYCMNGIAMNFVAQG